MGTVSKILAYARSANLSDGNFRTELDNLFSLLDKKNNTAISEEILLKNGFSAKHYEGTILYGFKEYSSLIEYDIEANAFYFLGSSLVIESVGDLERLMELSNIDIVFFI